MDRPNNFSIALTWAGATALTVVVMGSMVGGCYLDRSFELEALRIRGVSFKEKRPVLPGDRGWEAAIEKPEKPTETPPASTDG